MTSIARERDLYAQVGFTHRRRDQWGARFDYTTPQPVDEAWPGHFRAVDEPATRLFLHISVTDPSRYASNDAHARAIEGIGISRFPHTGLSYNEMIFPGGVPYEGQPMGRRGAHTVNEFQWAACATSTCPSRGFSVTAPDWNLNINSRACCLARNVDDAVTDVDVDTAARWAAAGKLSGMVASTARWHGHRCVKAKDCPGAHGWARLGDIADLTADYVRRGHVALEDDMGTIDDTVGNREVIEKAVMQALNRGDAWRPDSGAQEVAVALGLGDGNRSIRAVTEVAMANAGAAWLKLEGLSQMPTVDLEAIAKAVNDELGKRIGGMTA